MENLRLTILCLAVLGLWISCANDNSDDNKAIDQDNFSKREKGNEHTNGAILTDGKKPQQENEPGGIPPLNGSFLSLEGKNVDLSEDNGLPTVLIFAQDSCSICATETENFKRSLISPLDPPSLINLYTVLIGASLQDGKDWVEYYKPPWTVGVDEKLELFFSYFKPATKVPSIIVFHPKRGILLKQTGVVSVERIKSLTGNWEDNL